MTASVPNAVRILRPLRDFRDIEPPIQCAVRMARNPANPEHYFRYLKRKFDARGFDITLCGRSAMVEINGAPLCKQHAGEVALSILLCRQFADASAGEAGTAETTKIGSVHEHATAEGGDAQ